MWQQALPGFLILSLTQMAWIPPAYMASTLCSQWGEGNGQLRPRTIHRAGMLGVALALALESAPFSTLHIRTLLLGLLVPFGLWTFFRMLRTSSAQILWPSRAFFGLLTATETVRLIDLLQQSGVAMGMTGVFNSTSLGFAAVILLSGTVLWLGAGFFRTLARSRLERHPIFRWVSALFVASVLFRPLAEVTNGLYKLGWVSPSAQGLRVLSLSFSALEKFPSFQIAIVCVLFLALFFSKKQSLALPTGPTHDMSGPVKRLHQAEALKHRSHILGVLFSILALFLGPVSLAVVRELKPKLTAPQLVQAESGRIHIPLSGIHDGKLHRFLYAFEGRHARFFVMNRKKDSFAPTVVLDACQLCGDAGYVHMSEDEVMCLSCHNRVWLHTLGKPGGCNPIPLAFTASQDDLFIEESQLKASLRYFSPPSGG